ncbi:MAG: PAC2 family protein [Candidatus Anstonellales archaeon]
MMKLLFKKGLIKKNASLIVGLPGVAFVGRITVKYIVDKLGAKKIGRLISDKLPAQVMITKKGKLKPMQLSFYHLRLKDRDLIFLIGDIQPPTNEGQYEIANAIIKLCKKVGINEIITIGGYATGNLERNEHVLGASNNIEHINSFSKLGVIYGEAKGSILGLAGLLPALAGKIKGTCIMGETHGSFIDPMAAKRVLEILSKYFKFEIDYSEIDKAARKIKQITEKIEKEIKEQREHMEEGKKKPSYIQ